MAQTLTGRSLRLLRGALRGLAGRPLLRVLLPALLAGFLAAVPTLVAGTPEPQIHDEWGYLLSADTFAEGRLTNPTHPNWVAFETIHQFHRPSYQSKYPPAQALFLALGQVLWHPILGVWISVACLVGALVWMLLAWLPARWALLGGFFAIVQYVLQGEPFLGGTHAYWSQSYWGGAVAATGGALLFGAVARSLRSVRVGTSLAMVSGLLLLANSRPQEGLVVGLPCALYLGCWMLSSRAPAARVLLGRLVLPVVLGLVAGAVLMGTYNRRVTGDALEMPWQTHYEQYCVFPVMLWQEPPPDRDWRHAELAEFHGELELSFHARHQGPVQLAVISAKKLARFGVFFVGPLMGLLLLLLPWALRDPWQRFLALNVGLMLGLGLLTFGALPHYSAPAAGPVLALLVACLRHLRALSLGRRLGQLLLVGMLLLGGFGMGFAIQDVAAGRAHPRHRAQRRLEAQPGQHLVFVDYGPQHQVGDEWVFNAADLPGSKVLWARDMGLEANRGLLRAFPEHRAWRMRVRFDDGPQVPVPASDL